MRKIRILALALVAAALSSCGLTSPRSIPYTVAKHYFFNADAEVPDSPVVTDREAFDALYGEGAVMSKDGKPTEIDFTKQFTVGIVLPETDDYTTIVPGELVKEGGRLTLHYTLEYGEKDMSWTMRPMALIIVDKKHLPEECLLVEDE